MNRKVTKEQEKEIIELINIKSHREIGLIYNITTGGVRLILKRNNIIYRKCRLNLSKLDLNVDYFKYIDSYEKAYWLGYIAADGCISKNNNKVTLVSKDEEILIKFKESIKSGHKISETNYFDKRTNKIYNRYSIQISNEIFTNNLISQGITNNKTDVLKFPSIKEEYYSYFIAGLFDGDGSVSFYGKNKNNIRINLISTLEILNFIQRYTLKKLNITKLMMYKVTKNKKNVWKLYLYKDSMLFLDYIYQDKNFNYLQRKYNRYKNYKNE